MNILVFGGTGNISTDVAAALLNAGHVVTVVTSGNRPVPPQYQCLTADRHDRESLIHAIDGASFDVAIDFLCFNEADSETAYETLRGRVGQYILISSATVYRKPHTTLPLTEDMPRGNPFSEYARCKIACEDYFRARHGDDFPVTVVRPSHTFGKTWIPSPLNGSDWTVAARILAGKPIILHDQGQSLWALTAASDFAAALTALAGNPAAFGEAFHITTDQFLTWNGICFEVGLALGRQAEIVHVPTDFLEACAPVAREKLRGDKMEHGVFDNSKIKGIAPEWECRKSFRAAIREAVAWYREDDSRQVVNQEQDLLIDEIIGKWRAR